MRILRAWDVVDRVHQCMRLMAAARMSRASGPVGASGFPLPWGCLREPGWYSTPVPSLIGSCSFAAFDEVGLCRATLFGFNGPKSRLNAFTALAGNGDGTSGFTGLLLLPWRSGCPARASHSLAFSGGRLSTNACAAGLRLTAGRASGVVGRVALQAVRSMCVRAGPA